MAMVRKLVYPVGSDEDISVREELKQMALSGAYNTSSSYTPSNTDYPDGQIPFVDKHMRYLNANPKLDARMYLANLRLMTRVKQ